MKTIVLSGNVVPTNSSSISIPRGFRVDIFVAGPMIYLLLCPCFGLTVILAKLLLIISLLRTIDSFKKINEGFLLISYTITSSNLQFSLMTLTRKSGMYSLHMNKKKSHRGYRLCSCLR